MWNNPPPHLHDITDTAKLKRCLNSHFLVQRFCLSEQFYFAVEHFYFVISVQLSILCIYVHMYVCMHVCVYNYHSRALCHTRPAISDCVFVTNIISAYH